MNLRRRTAKANGVATEPVNDLSIQGSGNPGAFTIIELLTVMSVLGILTSLFLSTLGHARSVANSARCKSNLREIGLALQLYVDDYQAYPSGHMDLADGSRPIWADFLRPYLGLPLFAKHEKSILNCPGARSADETIDYAYNHQSYAGQGLGPTLSGSGSYLFVKENDVYAPARMIVAGDNLGRMGQYVCVLGRDLTRMVPNYDRALLAREGARFQRSSRQRHDGRTNLLFADGHAEALTLQRAFFAETEEALSLWNRDHQPHWNDWERVK